MFKVRVIEIKTGETVKVIDDIKDEVKAAEIERGLLLNMNRDEFCTEIVEVETASTF